MKHRTVKSYKKEGSISKKEIKKAVEDIIFTYNNSAMEIIDKNYKSGKYDGISKTNLNKKMVKLLINDNIEVDITDEHLGFLVKEAEKENITLDKKLENILKDFISKKEKNNENK
jgi:hypothetical protein